MQSVDEKKDTVTFRAKSRDEEGCTDLEKVEVHHTHNIERLKHIEKKLIDKGIHRKDRHPVHAPGQPMNRNPKSGHGGKYTWEGPAGDAAYEMEDVTAAMDEHDPNYVDEEAEERVAGPGIVVDPKLQANV